MVKKKKKAPLYPNKSIIKGALRRTFSRTPIVREVLEDSVHPTKKGIRGGKQFVCRECREAFPGKNVQVDHIKEVVPLNKSVHDMDYNEIVERLFCKKANLQVLCKECHSVKTTEERKIRKIHRDAKKAKLKAEELSNK
jgi:5-methylcytosine-specific restriction endonuclease McrA